MRQLAMIWYISHVISCMGWQVSAFPFIFTIKKMRRIKVAVRNPVQPFKEFITTMKHVPALVEFRGPNVAGLWRFARAKWNPSPLPKRVSVQAAL